MSEKENVSNRLSSGKGVQFQVSLSPENDTAETVKKWSVTVSQGRWKEEITSDNPDKVLSTGLSGLFQVMVMAAAYDVKPTLMVYVPAIPPGTNSIDCDPDSSVTIIIIADEQPVTGTASAKFRIEVSDAPDSSGS